MLDWFFGEPEERPEAFDQGLLDEADAGERWRAGQRPQRKRRRWLFNGARPEPVPSHSGAVEDPVEGKLGICCSGGGIRSAAFSLGALQTLQEENELRRASYLAAVSGGSYIAAAFSMVATARRDGTPPEESDDSDPQMLERMAPFAPGSPEEQYLRNRCSYMAPTFTDKVYIAFRILLGMLFNLIFVSLFLVGVAWIFTGLFLAPQLPDLVGDCSAGNEVCAANIPNWFWIAPVTMAGIAILIGWIGMLFKIRPDSRDRAVQVWAARLLLDSALVALVLVLLPTLVDVLLRPGGEGEAPEFDTPTSLVSFGSLFAGLIAGVVAQLWQLLRTKEGREGAAKAVKVASKAGNGMLKAIAYIAGGLLGPLILFFVVVAAVSLGLEWSSHGFDNWRVIGAGLLALGVFTIVYAITDLTTWSLHPYYKRRLATAFALKRVNPGDLTEDELNRVEALPSPAADSVGIAIERDFEKTVPLSQTALVDAERIDEDGEVTRRTNWPTLLVCAAANVSDPGATPPGRRVSSFTFSAHAVGGPLVGAIETKKLESAFNGGAEAAGGKAARVSRRRRRDLTLTSAVAMSGAAISPSMGKMTPQPLTLLMALGNLRLGVWVPNPRWVKGTDPDAKGIPEAERKRRQKDRDAHPRPRPIYLFREFLGRNRIDDRYLYVTDGGHYENLGLVELLRRGCTQVYCFDASGVGEGSAEFKELGDAIALARSELNVEITFGDDEDPADLQPRGEAGGPRFSRDQVVRGKIRYPGRDRTEGTLIYVRNVMTREAPWDAQAYQRTDPRFPNNPTIDQLYTDQKFESYRALGRLAAQEACERMAAT